MTIFNFCPSCACLTYRTLVKARAEGEEGGGGVKLFVFFLLIPCHVGDLDRHSVGSLNDYENPFSVLILIGVGSIWPIHSQSEKTID